MNKEKELIFFIDKYSKSFNFINEMGEKHNINFWHQKKPRFLPQDAFEMTRGIIEVFFLTLSALIAFTSYYFGLHIFPSSLLFLGLSHFLDVAFNFFLMNFENFKIKEKLILFELKYLNSTNKKMFLKRKIVFNQDRKKILEAMIFINSNEKKIRKELKKINPEILAKEYIKLLTTEQINDEGKSVFRVIRGEFDDATNIKIQRIIEEQNLEHNYMNY